MTFQEALEQATQGKIIQREGLDFQLKVVDNVIYVLDEDGETNEADQAMLLLEDYRATDWKVVGDEEVVAYFDRDKRRWVSTTNVEKHKALNNQVAIFRKVRSL